MSCALLSSTTPRNTRPQKGKEQMALDTNTQASVDRMVLDIDVVCTLAELANKRRLADQIDATMAQLAEQWGVVNAPTEAHIVHVWSDLLGGVK